MTTTTSRRATALACTLVLALAACGSDGDDAAPALTPPGTNAGATAADGSMNTDTDMDMDITAMNMGDPNATPADAVPDAALARGDFALLDTRPQGYDDATGTAVVARSAAGTTATIELSGLLPNVGYIAHLHAEPCAPNNGGPHYQFEVGGATVPPNEIHLAFTSDADGSGFMTAENQMVAGVEAQAVVIHPAEFLDNKVACADLVEDEPGTVAAAVEAGAEHDGPPSTDMPMTTDQFDPMDG